ncbi:MULTISPECIES: type II secretion system inner membrane protein GspF [Cupriavidus]|jgi:general secretion pathway protein F|uniref:Type II secretion system protein GspF n=1 Tax=Cupriavidus metallidurans TaxID=119219 RepID=A0A2L0XB47_9BURK|nr:MULTISPECIES: type II secretion system inner membrane protein GspF [Cupriavidus]PCH57498.1 MAG: type II secretion system protein GspF [Burkholderiaceae bacterium]AVA37337.1 type II secretion system protein GspF [Cupriavidus metallidurans]KWR84570.1 type II secretion system protein GspF [Cupriavidus sp. SHE]QBP11345.1 type II secretion system protein GspF [Cupriavidus metallidurans]QWC88419.1 type II secretion system inner membrane protein GspF [Cupriavidus metallidurans]
MPAYRYEAADAAGRADRGVIEADSPKQARAQLRARGLTPIIVDPLAGAGLAKRSGSSAFVRRLSTQEQALFTRQLASLIVSGLPLDEALGALADQAERQYVHELLAGIRAEVMGGSSLSVALAQHPKDFPDIYRALVSAGEHSGHLGMVLERLATYIETRNTLTSKIRLAFTYPAIVTVVAFAIVIFLLSYVVPQVVSVFANTKQKLPTLTVIMLALSDFVRNWWWAALGVIAAVVAIIRSLLKQPDVRLAWHRWLLTAPLVGKLIRGYNTARFASTLSILVSAGVPILRSLQAAGETLTNQALKANVEDATTRVREGASLARALAAQNQFPPVLVHLIRSGEATGNLPTMLDRAATGEGQELERRTMFLTSLLEPLLILTMGVVVLMIVLAVLMPIIEINQLVR